MYIIDTHAHIVPTVFPQRASAGWPSMVPLDDGNARMMIDGQLYRVIDRPYFDLEARLAYMERENISAQVISPLPELLGHWLPVDTGVAMAELTNATIAETVKQAPDKLAGLGMLPLQSVEKSVAMVKSIASLGLRGIEVSSNVDGVSIADAHFDPVFKALAENNLAVLVHGSRPPAPERQLGPKIMGNIIGIPQDCSTAISSFIITDILARAPGLRLGFVHAGGTFGSVLARMDAVWHMLPAMQESSPVSPRDYVRRFYFDTISYSIPYLRFIIGEFGEETIICGTDGPAKGGQSDLEGLVLGACDGDVARAKRIFVDNAVRFLGWDKPEDAPIVPKSAY